MAGKSRKVIGSVLKPKEEGKSNYIKIREDISLKQGECLSLESKEYQLKSLDAAAEAGKLSGEIVEQIRERINKIPDFVRFEIVRFVPK